MPVNKEKYREIILELRKKNVILVAVSKTKTVEEIMEFYELGHRDFGENYVQELTEKHFVLPKDIRWHFIGHLQSKKVKYISSFVHLVHGVDSVKLLQEINKQGIKHKRVIDCLLQVHIAQEETKFGLSEEELDMLFKDLPSYEAVDGLTNVSIRGLMGMASLTENTSKIRLEFKYLNSLFDKYSKIQTEHEKMEILSIGMSADYKIAVEEGSSLVRIGSLLFGERISKGTL
ncbi:MAG: YggS family pyridoxal phosphate-dependent enzyme [Chitinophagaceae bacterium]|nr:YggS family pyridoxal phosphate-dependent enzyme [Chitinophagaceae bacterium]